MNYYSSLINLDKINIKKFSSNIEFNIGDLLKENDDIFYF